METKIETKIEMQKLDILHKHLIEFLEKNHREPNFVVMNYNTQVSLIPDICLTIRLSKIEDLKVIISEDLKDNEFLFGIQ